MPALDQKTRRGRWSLAVVTLAVACADDADGNGMSDGGSPPSAQRACKWKDPGTNFAPCSDDGDCLGNFCDVGSKGDRFCYVPNRRAVDAFHGILCSNVEQCRMLLSAADRARGITVICAGNSNLDPAVCEYRCNGTDASSKDREGPR